MFKSSKVQGFLSIRCLQSVLLLFVIALSAPAQTLSLAGEWKFCLDPKGEGRDGRWYERTLAETIQMPASCEERGFGVPYEKPTVGRLTRVLHYEGQAWYQKAFTVPSSWNGKRVELFLERCHWETKVWIDGRFMGTQNSLSVPHVYSLGLLQPGKHLLTVCVDNTYKIPVGTWVHALTEDTQGNWNGMIGRLELRATSPVWFENAQVHKDCILVQVGNETARTQEVAIQDRPFSIPAGGSEVRLPFQPKGAEWDEFNPHLQRLTLKMKSSKFKAADKREKSDAGISFSEREQARPKVKVQSSKVQGSKVEEGDYEDSFSLTYGNRELGVRDKQVLVNGKPILLRGPVDECVYPLTGYPPMDKAAWLRILKICKSYGFNYMRFHSWCPPEAAFQAADEEGFYLQVELPFWSMDAPAYGKHAERDAYLGQELRRILDCYGNHPSFALMAMGNESSGPLERLVREGRERDNRHLYRAENGQTRDHGDFIETGMRGIAGPQTDWDRWSNGGWIAGVSGNGVSRKTGAELPTLGHEIGQWEMYPDFDEIGKYTGTLRALNFEGYRRTLEAHGMLGQAKDFARASGLFSVLLYKEDIEACMRTWPFAGFQILEARDYPGQGTAIVGWLDSFWDSKGLVTPRQFRQFCGPSVLLMQMHRRVFSSGETFEGFAEIANYTGHDIGIAPQWELRDEGGRMIARGKLGKATAQSGCVTNLGRLNIPLHVEKASRLTLQLKGCGLQNGWDIWVYPQAEVRRPDNVRVAYEYDEEVRRALAAGDRVLLFPDVNKGIFPVRPAFFGSDDCRVFPVSRRQNAVEGSFMPAFWNMRLFNQTGTLGLLCQKDHPALSGFPTEEHSNWQWADLLGRFSAAQSFRTAGAPADYCDGLEKAWGDVRGRSKAIVLNDAPQGFRPIVQAIDNFERNYRLGVIFETRVGKGRLLVCAIDLETDLANRPAARALKQSLFDYVAGPSFNPSCELDARMLDTVLTYE